MSKKFISNGWLLDMLKPLPLELIKMGIYLFLLALVVILGVKWCNTVFKNVLNTKSTNTLGVNLMIKTHWSARQNKHIPITEREIIPDICFHRGKRIGDIVIREAAGVPLIICGYETLDDGSGGWDFVFFHDNSYRVIGSIYEKGGIELIMPMLIARNRSFDYDSYGLNRNMVDTTRPL